MQPALLLPLNEMLWFWNKGGGEGVSLYVVQVPWTFELKWSSCFYSFGELGQMIPPAELALFVFYK